MSHHALIGSVNHNMRNRQCLAYDLAQGRVVRRRPHTIHCTDSVWVRTRQNCPNIQAVSGFLRTHKQCVLCVDTVIVHMPRGKKPSWRTGWLMISRSAAKSPSVTSDLTYSYSGVFADCRGHDLRSPTTVTACQLLNRDLIVAISELD